MPEFANYIIGRSHNSSWVVSFKALITIHHLMNAGSEVNYLCIHLFVIIKWQLVIFVMFLSGSHNTSLRTIASYLFPALSKRAPHRV